jgi:hypothetical protein
MHDPLLRPGSGRSSLTAGPTSSVRSARRGRSLVPFATIALLAGGLFAPASVVARTGVGRTASADQPAVLQAGHSHAGVLSAKHQTIGRDIGRATAVDPREAAREAKASPRASKPNKRFTVDLGAGKATKSPSSAARNLVGSATGTGGTAAATGGTTRSSLGATPLVVTQPAPIVTTSFPGITQPEACPCEPPDPWIAVSPSFVVQTTNGLVRMSSRSGTTLLSMPTWALFAVPVDRADSDPRILWDQVHSRWVGVITTFGSHFVSSGLRLAVSETADPTAGWIVYSIESPGLLADFPGISSSSTRVVLATDDFLDDGTFLGPTFVEMDWSNILAGTSLYIGGFSFRANPGDPPPSFGHFRPAIALSTAVTTPVIYEAGDSPGYFEIGGTAHAPTFGNIHFLTDEFGVEAFTLPPAPVEPGALTIAGAVDERPTDAVYRNGSVWFAATGDYPDGSDHWDKARWTRVMTTANGANPTAATDFWAFASGVDYFMPGVGINGRGSAIMAVTATDPDAMNPTTLIGGYLAGTGITTLVEIETSPTAYVGDRWGDFLGIAADPSGTGSVWLAHELADATGTWRTSVVRIVSDGTPPGAPGTIIQAPVIPSTLGATVPIRVVWGSAADADSGVKAYLVERSDDLGGFFGAQIPGTTITQALLIGHTVQYRITAIDDAGNVGLPTLSAIYRPTLYQSSTSATKYSASWTTSKSASFSGGSARYATKAGASATFTVTAARSIAIVTTKAATRGSFKVYVDGVFKATINTHATTTRFRQLLYQIRFSSPGTHKIKIVVSGSSGHPRVDLDAFVVLR